MNTQIKQCTKCGEVKPLSCFGKERNGLRSQCKSCRVSDAKIYSNANPERVKQYKVAWYQKNRERILAEMAKKYKNNPFPVKERVKKWSEINYERKEITTARWHKENPERGKVARYKWRKIHPITNRTMKRNRRLRIRSVPGNGWNSIQEEQLINDYDHRCAYCGNKTDKLTMDHVVSIASGGNHSIDNIVPACGFCNSSKRDKPLLVWMYQRRINYENT